jgi:hypothetical protein
MITPFSNWCDLTDLQIVDDPLSVSNQDRNLNMVCEKAVMDMASEGDVIARVPKRWTEQDIKIALRLANDAYIRSFETGERNVKNQFKRVLGIHQ